MRLHKLTQALMLVLAPLCVQAADTAKPVVNLYTVSYTHLTLPTILLV